MSDLKLLLTFRSGPLISPAAKKRVTGLIASCEEEGGKILLDGRNVQVPSYPDGNFVGPTILTSTTDMRCYKYVERLAYCSSSSDNVFLGRKSSVLF
jgi:hypothetical protein